ncbi:MAG: hypothetical protein ACE5HU_08775 [Acidobacteriota bacterium]
MVLRLGESLVKKGIITARQLRKALQAQLIFGMHLGSCLMMLGFIDEEELAEVLAEATKIRVAHGHLFESIPPRVINSIPQPFVAAHRTVPFQIQDRALHVAMVDPNDTTTLENLSFLTGLRVEPWLAPELRIIHAMEKYYDIPRPRRCIAVSGHGPKESSPRVKSPGTVEPAVFGRANHAGTRKKARAAVPPRSAGVDGDLARVAEALIGAEDKEDLADVVLELAARFMGSCCLFHVKAGNITVWGARGLALEGRALERMKLPTACVPFFRKLRQNGHYRGKAPADVRTREFYEALGIAVPAEILLLPIYHEKGLVGIFHGGSGPGKPLKGDTAIYRRLMGKLVLGINLTLMKRKIRAS